MTQMPSKSDYFLIQGTFYSMSFGNLPHPEIQPFENHTGPLVTILNGI